MAAHGILLLQLLGFAALLAFGELFCFFSKSTVLQLTLVYLWINVY